MVFVSMEVKYLGHDVILNGFIIANFIILSITLMTINDLQLIGLKEGARSTLLYSFSLREKCPNKEFFLVCVFPHLD